VDWQGLLHNRWVWIGGAGAAGLGALAYVRRKKAGGAGGGAAATVGAQATPAYAGGVGGFDSTGTDVAAWLGNYSGNLQHQLDAYQQQLTDTLAGMPTGATGTGAGPSAGGSSMFAAANQNLYELGDLNQLRQLNPNLDSLILWADPTPQHPFLTPHLQTGMNLRVS
jgi:hypothetical protein